MGRSYRVVGMSNKRNSFRNQELERIEDEETELMLEEAKNKLIEENDYERP